MAASDHGCKKSRVKVRGKRSKGQRRSSMKTAGFDYIFVRSNKNVKTGWTAEERARGPYFNLPLGHDALRDQ